MEQEIRDFLMANEVNKLEIAHNVIVDEEFGDGDNYITIVNTVEQFEDGRLVCYDNRDEDFDGSVEPMFEVRNLTEGQQKELVWAVKNMNYLNDIKKIAL